MGQLCLHWTWLRHQLGWCLLHTLLLGQQPLGLCPCHGSFQECERGANLLKHVSVRVVFISIPLAKASQAPNKGWRSALSPPWSHETMATIGTVTSITRGVKNWEQQSPPPHCSHVQSHLPHEPLEHNCSFGFFRTLWHCLPQSVYWDLFSPIMAFPIGKMSAVDCFSALTCNHSPDAATVGC